MKENYLIFAYYNFPMKGIQLNLLLLGAEIEYNKGIKMNLVIFLYKFYIYIYFKNIKYVKMFR